MLQRALSPRNHIGRAMGLYVYILIASPISCPCVMYRVSYDSPQIPGLIVHRSNGTNHVFMLFRKVSFFSDVKCNTAHVMINSVDRIKNKLTIKDIQDIIGQPSIKDYTNYVERDLLQNCLITKTNILTADDTLGPNLGSLKRKSTWKTLSRVIFNTHDNLANGMLEEDWNITLAVDIMYINKIFFIITTSQAIHFGTANMI